MVRQGRVGEQTLINLPGGHESHCKGGQSHIGPESLGDWVGAIAMDVIWRDGRSSARVLDLADLRLYADEPVSRFRDDQHPVVLRGRLVGPAGLEPATGPLCATGY